MRVGIIGVLLGCVTITQATARVSVDNTNERPFIDEVLEGDDYGYGYHPGYQPPAPSRESFIYATLRYLYTYVLAGFLTASEQYPEYQQDLAACKESLAEAIEQLAEGKITTMRAFMRIEAVALRLMTIFMKVHKKKIGKLAIGCLLIGVLLIDYYTNDARITRSIRAGVRRVGHETMRLTMYLERAALRVFTHHEHREGEYAS